MTPIIDPQSAPVDSIAGEPAVESSRLNPDWIRKRFQHPAVWQPESSDEHCEFLLENNEFRHAAVLIGVVQRAHGLTVLFTQRTAHLSQHAGQISFPGGRAEAEDKNAIATALRETQEEIGLDPSKIEILGTLPNYFTITGYCVTPVVASIADIGELTLDQNEVAEIFEVPLPFLMDGKMHQRRTVTIGQSKRLFYAMPYQDYFIWGATAGMLRNLFHFLRT